MHSERSLFHNAHSMVVLLYIYIYIYIYTYIYISHFVLVKTYYCRCNVTKDIIFTDCNLFFFSIFKLLGLKLSAYLCVIIIMYVMSIVCM